MRLRPSGLRSSGPPGSRVQQAPSAGGGAIRAGRGSLFAGAGPSMRPSTDAGTTLAVFKSNAAS
jgi:hypothetical protein